MSDLSNAATVARMKALLKRDAIGVRVPEDQLEAIKQRRTEKIRAAQTAERTRIKAILSSPEAAERPVAARGVALRSDFSLEEAVDFLRTLPLEAIRQAAKGGPSMGFAQYMKNLNPSVPPSYDPESAALFGDMEPRLPDAQGIYARRAAQLAAQRAQANSGPGPAHGQEHN